MDAIGKIQYIWRHWNAEKCAPFWATKNTQRSCPAINYLKSKRKSQICAP